MLVLSRKVGETIIIGDAIQLTVVAIHNNRVRLGVTAPLDISVLREELRNAQPSDRPFLEDNIEPCKN
ncbi:MAG: carbon storage regulator [Pirellulaceae bacterium]